MPDKPLLPLAFQHPDINCDRPITVLAGDVGGTKTNMAMYRADVNGITQLREARYTSHEYTSLTEIIVHFTGTEWPDRICMAVAGPVLHGKVSLTNLLWQLDSNAMSIALKVPVAFLNDLEANAYGLAGLHGNELATINSGNARSPGNTGNIAIIAAGTGLGEAGMYFDGKRYHPFPTEGGHCDFAPRTETDVSLWRFLEQQNEHVSWERILSGPGIQAIFQFLTTVERRPVHAWLQEQLLEDDPAAVISNSAQHRQEPVCIETLQSFSRYLAMEAANLVLKLKAIGGCYLSGGIAPKVLSFLQTGQWYNYFIDTGRMKPLLSLVPVYVILNSKTPLLGAAYYGAYSM
ncbi:MAG: glucokinase [Ginsengibacter sp.]